MNNKGRMNGLDLFSGIGGISLALEEWVKTAAYCEINTYAQRVLLARMRDGGLDYAPIWDDVRTLRAADLPTIDIIFGGFPCQDISLAGKRAGLEGKRSGLYREVIRLVDECKPSFVFLENVAAIRGYAWRVIEDLAALGFDCRWTDLSASEVGAPHKRNRWWLLATNTDRATILGKPRRGGGATRPLPTKFEQNGKPQLLAAYLEPELAAYWAAEPNVDRVDHGVPFRVDRLAALGNAVVPAQARTAFRYLLGA